MAEFKCSDCGAGTGDVCSRTNEPAIAMTPVMVNDYWRKIQDLVCEPRWTEWRDMDVKIINEYQLNMLERDHRQMLRQHMNEFLALEGSGGGAGELCSLCRPPMGEPM